MTALLLNRKEEPIDIFATPESTNPSYWLTLLIPPTSVESICHPTLQAPSPTFLYAYIDDINSHHYSDFQSSHFVFRVLNGYFPVHQPQHS